MSIRSFLRRMTLVLCGVLAAQASAAQAPTYPELSVSTGLHYSRGDYGTDAEIEDIYIPLGFMAEYERVAFSVRVPYLSVDTTSEGVTTTESGLGDVSASLTAFNVVYNGDLGLALDITGAFKFGTADREQGLGTGEDDVTLYFDGYKFFDNATLFASAGYRWRGEPPEVILEDVLLATLGVTSVIGDGRLFGASVDYRESAIAEFDDITELQAFFVLPLGDAWDLEIYAFTGFTDSSPAWGAGFTLAADLRRLALRRDR